MTFPTTSGAYAAELKADERIARRLNEAATEWLSADIAVSIFERAKNDWSVIFHFARSNDESGIRQFVRDVAGEECESRLQTTTVAAQNWIAASLEGLKPVHAGRFVVHGRHDRARIASNRIAIEIEAALAFGTGHHGTTRGCLLALDRLLKSRHASSVQNVLDIGTGTGVLAIAAAKAQRRRVIASDIDHVTVQTARRNARSNRAANFIATIRASSLRGSRIRAHAPYDLIFANILIPVLKSMARSASLLLAPRGTIILSGLLPEHANAAIAAYRIQGLALEYRIALEGWVTLVMKRGYNQPRHDPFSGYASSSSRRSVLASRKTPIRKTSIGIISGPRGARPATAP